MFCYKCGAAMADDARQCSSCGTPAPAITGVAAPGIAPLPPPSPGNMHAATTQATGAVPQYFPPPPTDDKAVVSLVLGVLSLVSFSIFAGIPAIILGNAAREKIRASSGRLSGESMATAGIVMGWVSVGLAGLVLLIVLLMVFTFGVLGPHHHF